MGDSYVHHSLLVFDKFTTSQAGEELNLIFYLLRMVTGLNGAKTTPYRERCSDLHCNFSSLEGSRKVGLG